MYFYHIKLKNLPHIKFACICRTDQYKNIITHRSGMIEIAIQSEAVHVEEKTMMYDIPGKAVSVIMPDLDARMSAVQLGDVYLGSAAICGEFEYERIVCEEPEEIAAMIQAFPEDLFLPRFLELEDEYEEFERMLRRLIAAYLKESGPGNLQASAVWCEMIAWVDERFRERVLGKKCKNTGDYYTRKIKRYVEKHYSEKLEVRRLAEMLGVSPNYVSSIFQKHVGMSLTEYITRVRLEHARNLAYEGVMDYDEIAAKVGFCNRTYMNKLFHKYYGVSIRNVAMTDHEISLYHEKPWNRQKLEHDIYEE